jgi:Ion channel
VALQDRDRWYPGRRVDRIRASRSYGSVLVLTILAILFAAGAPDDGWAWSAFVLLQAGLLAVAMWTSGLGRAGLRFSALVIGGAFVLALLQITWAGDGNGVAGIVNGILGLATCVVIAVGVVDQREINAQSVIGVITIYLMIGLLFAFAYSAIALLGDGPLFAQGTDGTLGTRVYFSFVTLATLGYGDILPVHPAARSLATLEAVTGTLYLAILIARLVSLAKVPGREEDPDA